MSQNLDLELPATDGQTLYDVRYQDEDVVLALEDSDVTTGETNEVTFGTLFEFTIAGIPQQLGRGYQTVETTVKFSLRRKLNRSRNRKRIGD